MRGTNLCSIDYFNKTQYLKIIDANVNVNLA